MPESENDFSVHFWMWIFFVGISTIISFGNSARMTATNNIAIPDATIEQTNHNSPHHPQMMMSVMSSPRNGMQTNEIAIDRLMFLMLNLFLFFLNQQ